ncbi:DBR1 domain-containing protein [Heracleum sosnowskyi]|uniref:DBR1 domain-containing protein n=1 Tax=Heracleum sosnowskyi TaxID=360622 RepID=A0AAD8HGW5_9APIA|nr:DBR1 domain-containing protein [Heracleum sosnowskyi]
MKIAIEGCMHGDLDNVYATLLHLQQSENTTIDLLLCCGDFQAVRNESDLESLNCPAKFKSMQSFWKYYSGQKVAPITTIFIGGNHEASNYLWELYYGGWTAPNIYFLGFAGVIKFGNIRIGGLSGIYNERHYRLGHHEKLPYSESHIRSIYHVREYDVHKLMQIEEPIDIFLTHDWPCGITDYGNWKELVRRKPFFEKEIQDRTLGTVVQHGEGGPMTKFLALDKCLPGRKFLQIVEIESEPGPHEIHFDEEWLAITRKFNSIFPSTTKPANFGKAKLDKQECMQWIRHKLQQRGAKPFEFVQTVPGYDPSQSSAHGSYTGHHRNPQTEAFLQFLELNYYLDGTSETGDPIHSPASFITNGASQVCTEVRVGVTCLQLPYHPSVSKVD